MLHILKILVLSSLGFSFSSEHCPFLNSPDRGLFKAQMRGNLLFPQTTIGFRLAMLSYFALNPLPAKRLFEDQNPAQAMRLMNYAHLRHGVEAFTADFSRRTEEAKVIEPVRGTELTRGAFRTVALDLLSFMEMYSSNDRVLTQQIFDLLNLKVKDPYSEEPFRDSAIEERIDHFFNSALFAESREDLRRLATALDQYLSSSEVRELSRSHTRYVTTIPEDTSQVDYDRKISLTNDQLLSGFQKFFEGRSPSLAQKLNSFLRFTP